MLSDIFRGIHLDPLVPANSFYSSFFPTLISDPFRDGLHEAFLFAIVACLVAAAASLLRGGRVVEEGEDRPAAEPPAPRRGAPAPAEA